MTKTELIKTLQTRFAKHPHRHQGVVWTLVQQRLEAAPKILEVLAEMERTGGEPDVVLFGHSEEIVFVDCAAESPAERRSLCYDREAFDSRKENKPRGSALEFAAQMGIELLTEEEYRWLQTLDEFDKKTSSWVQTPTNIRKLGGALFCDRRYNHVFTYHNGAESYYAARGFRGLVRV